MSSRFEIKIEIVEYQQGENDVCMGTITCWGNESIIDFTDVGDAIRCALKLQEIGKSLFCCDCDNGTPRDQLSRNAFLNFREALAKEAEADADKYPVDDWRYEAMNGDTRLGYDEWKAHQLDAEVKMVTEDIPIREDIYQKLKSQIQDTIQNGTECSETPIHIQFKPKTEV